MQADVPGAALLGAPQPHLVSGSAVSFLKRSKHSGRELAVGQLIRPGPV
jgi:hypothetical protein